MLPFVEELRKKQNKEEVFNRRMAKKRVDVNDRNLESETPSKVKKVDIGSENESKVIENTGEFFFHKFSYLFKKLKLN